MRERPGEASGQVDLLGRRYAIGIRVVTLVPTAVVAVLAADGPAARAGAMTVMLLIGAWSAFYVVRLRRRRDVAVSIVDVVVLCCLGAIAAVLTPAAWVEAGRTWVRPFATFAAVGHQYSTAGRTGIPAGLAICSTATVASLLAQDGSVGFDAIVTVVWSNMIPLLARILFTLLENAARRADAAIADAEEARREQELAQSLRADERYVSDSLHDTAATTLLMVAIGQTGGAVDVLRRRARHDLETVRAMRTPGAPVVVDLAVRLRAAVGLAAVDTVVRGPDRLDVPPEVGEALVSAAGEVLTNVARHAGVAAAHLRFGERDGLVFVTVIDDGRGFDPAFVPATRRGLQRSVHGRMALIGGAARIVSAPGTGTTVDLEWSP